MAFQKLITACTFKSVLQMFDSKKSIHIKTDASDLIIKRCFMQEYKRKHHFIAYHFRKMSSVEQNYNIHDKELLAIMKCLDQ